MDDHLSLFETARSLFRENWKGEPMRLLGISVSALEKRGDDQLELFAQDDKAKALREALDQVRDKLGEASVVPAGSLAHRRTLGHVPFGPLKRREPRGYGEGADPSAPDPTQLKPRLGDKK